MRGEWRRRQWWRLHLAPRKRARRRRLSICLYLLDIPEVGMCIGPASILVRAGHARKGVPVLTVFQLRILCVRGEAGALSYRTPISSDVQPSMPSPRLVCIKTDRPLTALADERASTVPAARTLSPSRHLPTLDSRRGKRTMMVRWWYTERPPFPRDLAQSYSARGQHRAGALADQG
ncbi:hypothetical protein B0H11DRAFT_1031994 [Mycena galericulata]|nr:hypothetical protein B0H11DRAFT_1031994 [Mycena galericulata]